MTDIPTTLNQTGPNSSIITEGQTAIIDNAMITITHDSNDEIRPRWRQIRRASSGEFRNTRADGQRPI